MYMNRLGENMVFKCKCMNNHYSRVCNSRFMSGYWSHHMSIIHILFPTGLHRDFYRYDSVLNDFVPIKYRKKQYSMDKKTVWNDLRCVEF